jgi:hypothetical protein
MPINIFKGFVADYDNGSSSAGAGAGLMVITFAIGNPPVKFWSPFSYGERPFAAGDYVAVAGKRSLVPGVDQVALAYRRLGTSGNAHFLNIGLPSSCIFFGVIGVFGGLFLGPLNASTRSLAGVLLAIGLFGIWRLWSMHTACRMLDKLELPASTYRQEQ